MAPKSSLADHCHDLLFATTDYVNDHGVVMTFFRNDQAYLISYPLLSPGAHVTEIRLEFCITCGIGGLEKLMNTLQIEDAGELTREVMEAAYENGLCDLVCFSQNGQGYEFRKLPGGLRFRTHLLDPEYIILPESHLKSIEDCAVFAEDFSCLGMAATVLWNCPVLDWKRW